MSYLDDMSVFVEVARAGGFSRASANSGIPVSTLSRRLAQFEKRLGFKLLNRTTRRVQLTPLGHDYLQECERIVRQAESAHENLMARRDTFEGLIRISTTPDFGANFLAPILDVFARRHPQVTFDLDLTPQLSDMIASDIDVAVRFGNPTDSQLTARRLGTVRHWLCATPAYLAQYGTPMHPRELSQHCGIVVRRAGAPSPFVLSRGEETFELGLQERFRSNHLGMLVALALLNIGVVWLPDSVANAHLLDGRLVRVLPDWNFPAVPVLLLTVSRLQPARVRAFIDHLLESAGDVLLSDEDPTLEPPILRKVSPK